MVKNDIFLGYGSFLVRLVDWVSEYGSSKNALMPPLSKIGPGLLIFSNVFMSNWACNFLRSFSVHTSLRMHYNLF